METLSRVMMPWDWMGMVMIRSDTRRRMSIIGTIRVRPGSRIPMTRPRRNSTPFSYCLTIRTERASPSRASTPSTIRTVTNAAIPNPFFPCRCRQGSAVPCPRAARAFRARGPRGAPAGPRGSVNDGYLPSDWTLW